MAQQKMARRGRATPVALRPDGRLARSAGAGRDGGEITDPGGHGRAPGSTVARATR